MTESNLWGWLAKSRKDLGKGLHMRRTENAISSHDPDIDGVWIGSDFALEMKHAARPARPSTKLAFGSPLKLGQVEWGEDRLAAGGAHGFLISVGTGADRKIYLVPGDKGRWLLALVTEQDLTQYRVMTPVETIRRAINLRSF